MEIKNVGELTETRVVLNISEDFRPAKCMKHVSIRVEK